jgi:GxxExxY protein
VNKATLDDLTARIIGAAIRVHKALGPGLLESTYETCLVFELRSLGLKVEQQRPVPIVYRDVKLECGYRLDLVVENLVIVEIKAVDNVLPVHKAQLLSYLRLIGLPVGLLINFHVKLLKDGVARVVNQYPETL